MNRKCRTLIQLSKSNGMKLLENKVVLITVLRAVLEEVLPLPWHNMVQYIAFYLSYHHLKRNGIRKHFKNRTRHGELKVIKVMHRSLMLRATD